MKLILQFLLLIVLGWIAVYGPLWCLYHIGYSAGDWTAAIAAATGCVFAGVMGVRLMVLK